MNDREFAAALRDRDAILILSHLRPDGDTLGSGAALCSALRRMGKTAYLFPNPETTARYLPYVAQFFAPANFVPACVVAVDIATPNLFPQGFSGAVDLCIDHHPSNALYAGDTLLHAEKSACGEAVLDVIELLTGRVTEQEANLLYIAVTTDRMVRTPLGLCKRIFTHAQLTAFLISIMFSIIEFDIAQIMFITASRMQQFTKQAFADHVQRSHTIATIANVFHDVQMASRSF